MSPAELLMDRLSLGLSSPDCELTARAQTCAAWFEDHPEERTGWLPRLRETGRHRFTAELWEAVRDIIEGQRAPISVSAPISASPEPPTCSGDTAMLRARYTAWRNSAVSDSAFIEAKKYAPARVSEALDLEDGADTTRDPAALRAILQRAGDVWSDITGSNGLHL